MGAHTPEQNCRDPPLMFWHYQLASLLFVFGVPAVGGSRRQRVLSYSGPAVSNL